MKKIYFLLIGVVCFAMGGFSQVAVTVTNPTNTTPNLAASYTSLANAVTALSSITAISGPVTLTCAAGTETNPAGGYVINFTAATTAVNNVTIIGTGATITAPSPAGTAGNLNDAIFKIIGSDFVTIQGFTMNENVANTTTAAATNNMVEWGVALLYASTTNGAQNCTIQNNTITLNRTYQNTFGIYSNSTHSATAVTTSATATTTAGGNSGLKVYSNTISNVNNGISIVGPTAAADHNTGIEVGGTAGTANTITNYGTTGTFSAYANVSGTVNGILVRNSDGFTASFNSVTSSAGGVTAGTLNGIQVPAASVAPTATFTNNINNNTISLQSGLAGGAINGINYPSGSASATSVVNVNANNFTQLNHSVAGTAAIVAIIVTSTNLTTSISNNTFTNLTTNTTGSFTFISNSITVPAGGSQTINNNSIVTAFSKTGAGGTVTGITSAGSSTTVTQNWNNNNFSNMTVTGATAITFITNTDGGSVNHNITGNTFNNITGGTSSILGINSSFGGANGGNGNLVSNNTITNITSAGAINAIQIGSSGTSSTVTGNIIRGLTTTGASQINGIISSAPTSCNIFKNTICNLEANNASGTVNGIAINAGTLHTIYNNRIADLRTPTANAAVPLAGINIGGGTTVNAYFNTVSLNATSSGALFGSSAIIVSTTPSVTLRNNIFVNNSTPVGATGFTTAHRRSSTTLTSYGATSDNNLFYAGIPGANNLIFHDGTNSDQTLAAYKIRVASRDAVSVTENPPFLSTTCGNANFLKIDPVIATQIESGGSTVAGITDDYDGDVRNVTTPDIGSDEGTFTLADLTGPSIVVTPLSNSCTGGDRTLSATITDASGVPTSGAGLPVAYWKINAGAYTAATGTSMGGGVYQFTIGTGSVAADVVSYFVAAQDNLANISVTPSGGASGFTANPPAASTPPTTPLSYTILNTLSGTKTVGVGGDFTTLTAAAAAWNTNCISGAVIFNLTDATYPGETFPITFNANPASSAVNTLTIKPAAGASPLISGSVASGALIKFNGTSYVTVDGSNSGGTTRDLTITNTNVTAPTVVSLISLGTGQGAANMTIKNCNISTGVATSIGYGIAVGGATPGTAGADNDNVTIQNNNITAAPIGIYANGTAAVSAGGDDNLNITGNTIDYNATLASIGIQAGNALNSTVSLNNITEQTTTTQAPTAISLETGFVSSSVTRNNISKSLTTNTGGYGGRGITVGTGTATSSLTIANNFVSGVNGSNWSSFGNSSSMGIVIGTIGSSSTVTTTAGGINLYYNTVSMTGSMGSGSTSALTAALYVGSGASALDVRNNILANTQVGTATGQKNYAIYSAAANTAFTSIDYNDYFVSNTFNAPSAILGNIGATDRTTLAAMITGFGGNANAQNAQPAFVSASDLHLVTTDPTNLNFIESKAIAISIVSDIDGDARGATPDIGADEITVPPCSGSNGGTAALGSSTICAGGSTTLTATGYTTNATGLTYQWQYSTDNFVTDINDITGQTNPATANTGTRNVTTQFRLKVTCSNGPSTGYSNIVTLTVNPKPTTPVTPSGIVNICSPSTQTLDVSGTNAASPTFQWIKNGAAISGETNATYVASTTGNYRVRVQDGITSCFDTSATVVLSVNPPPVPTANVSSTSICIGNTVNLTSGPSTPPATALSEGFEAGAPGWTFTDSSSTGTSLAQQVWHIQAAPYTDPTGSITFSNFSVTGNGFAYANADAGGSGSQTRTFMTSPSFSTVGYTQSGLTLTYKMCYKFWSSSSPAEQVKVQITTDGGTTWTDLANYSPTNTGPDVGVTTNNAQVAVPVTVSIPGSFMGQPNVQLRWRYLSNFGYVWIVDDVLVTGTPITYSYSWASTPVGFSSTSQNPSNVKPTVNTTYTVTVTGGGCSANASTALVNVTGVTPATVIAGISAPGASTPESNGYAVNAGATDYLTNCKAITTITPSGASPVTGVINSEVRVDSGTTKMGTPRLFGPRIYAIEPVTNPGTSTATVTLYYLQSEFDNYNLKALDSNYYDLPGAGNSFNTDSLRIVQYHGTPTGGFMPGNYTGANEEFGTYNGATVVFDPAGNNGAGWWKVTVPVSSFSGFFLSSKPRPPLPVKIEYFRGTKQGNNHVLDWKVTCISTQYAKMTVEVSKDSRNFSGIYNITESALRCQQPFSFNNTNPFAGINYYRLRMEDDHGVVTYSSIVALINGIKGFEIVNITPNPVTDGRFKLNITSAEQKKMEVFVTDVTGRVVLKQTENIISGFNAIDMNVSKLAGGTYQIFGVTAEGRTRVLQFVKQ